MTQAGSSGCTPVFERLLITGAAGGLGGVLRPRLAAHCRVLRLSDIAPLQPPEAQAHEEIVPGDLQDAQAVMRMVQGVQAIVHLGGVSTEQPWAPILAANVVGMVNLYEAARIHQVRRIVFASSNHVMGFYRQGQIIDAQSPPRPDGFYGLSKAFGEDVAQMYWHRWGIETVSLRIGSSFAQPRDRRMLSTWLSYDDLYRLVVASLGATDVGHTIVYGASNNRELWYDNHLARHIGFEPQDSSEEFRREVLARSAPQDPHDPAVMYQGGAFVKATPHG